MNLLWLEGTITNTTKRGYPRYVIDTMRLRLSYSDDAGYLRRNEGASTTGLSKGLRSMQKPSNRIRGH